MTDMNVGGMIGETEFQSAGAALASRRRQMGWSIDEVANKLKLGKKQVEAIEADRFGQLPGNTFVRGFVKNYARLLEMDAAPLLRYLDQHLPNETPQAALPQLREEAMPILGLSGARGRTSTIGIVLGLAAVGLVSFGIWKLSSQRSEPTLSVSKEAVTSSSAVPVTMASSLPRNSEISSAATKESSSVTSEVIKGNEGGSSASEAPKAVDSSALPPVGNADQQSYRPPEAIAATASHVDVASTSAIPATAGNELKIVADADTWVMVVDSQGVKLASELMRAGMTKDLKGVVPYRIRIGNAPHTKLYFKGQTVDLGPYTKTDVANLELK